MNYLLYCIFRNSGRREMKLPRGIEGRPVVVVKGNDLCAAVSATGASGLPPGISAILAYEGVIKSIHRRQAVIPLRYGCVLGQESDILELLEERRRQYALLLQELEDRAEMGVRVLFDKTEAARPIAAPNGAAYLASRRDRYACDDRLDLEQELVKKQICGLLSGLFSRCATELHCTGGRRLLSLHFLVAKNSIKRFRQAFARIGLPKSIGLLLSGPWPPYSFCAEIQQPGNGLPGIPSIVERQGQRSAQNCWK